MASTRNFWSTYVLRGAALLALGAGFGACTLTLDSTALIQACVRNADCETGLFCAAGTCLPPVLDGGAEASDANETVDSDLPPSADAGTSSPPGTGQSDGGIMDASADAGAFSPPRTIPSDAGAGAGAGADAATGTDDAGNPDAASGTHDAGTSSPPDGGSDEILDAGVDGGITVDPPSDAGLQGNDGGIATNDSGPPSFQDGGEL